LPVIKSNPVDNRLRRTYSFDAPLHKYSKWGAEMKITAIDGHPGTDRLVTALMDRYLDAAEKAGAEVSRFSLRDMSFDPVLHEGYKKRQEWEADLKAAAESIQRSNHLLLGFPLWWGGQPALLKGFFDRVFLPGYAFKYHDNDPKWDRLLSGRSADVFITADTPRIYLQFAYGDPVLRQMKRQVLGFSGFKPVKQYYFAPIRKREPENFKKWLEKAEKLGRNIVKG